MKQKQSLTDGLIFTRTGEEKRRERLKCKIENERGDKKHFIELWGMKHSFLPEVL